MHNPTTDLLHSPEIHTEKCIMISRSGDVALSGCITPVSDESCPTHDVLGPYHQHIKVRRVFVATEAALNAQ